MKILLTGMAGFIGFHTVKQLLADKNVTKIIAIDNINEYYDVNLKYGRLSELGIDKNDIEYNSPVISTIDDRLTFIKLDLTDKENIFFIFENENFDRVCHLAAQAGVRYSIEKPYTYIDSNITGFMNILEACRNFPVEHLVYASSSSVYGMNDKVPFSENDKTDSPVSLYAATKKSNELMAHAYSKLYNIPVTGLRFFTVYGPWGRPDMAPFLFTKAIADGKSIKVFNNGDMGRDFTYIDDIVEGVIKVIYRVPGNGGIPYDLFNIGNSDPVKLMDFISEIEGALGKEAEKVFLPMQPGDVYQTFADTTHLEEAIGFKPATPLKDGVKKFVNWYKWFYNK